MTETSARRLADRYKSRCIRYGADQNENHSSHGGLRQYMDWAYTTEVRRKTTTEQLSFAQMYGFRAISHRPAINCVARQDLIL